MSVAPASESRVRARLLLCGMITEAQMQQMIARQRAEEDLRRARDEARRAKVIAGVVGGVGAVGLIGFVLYKALSR